LLVGAGMSSRSVFLFIAASAACASEDPGPEPVTSGAYHHYVTSAIRVPTTAELQVLYGLDIDGDPDARPDNQLATVFVALSSNSDTDLQARANDALAAGSLIALHSVRADGLDGDRSVSWRVYRGTADGPPAFDGSDTFDIAAGDASEPVLGPIVGGAFGAHRGGAGRLALEIAVSDTDPPIALDLIGARVQAEIDDAGCSGKLGGAVTRTDVETVLIPTVVSMMNAAIARDPGCPDACTAGSTAALVVEVFDADMDGMVTAQELLANSFIQSMLAPDVDLLDDDGVAESISIGVGFDCVAATFDAPQETP
jgi:hypothetical protein